MDDILHIKKIYSLEKFTRNADLIVDALRDILGKKKQEENLCSYSIRSSRHHKSITLDCKNCRPGRASITDHICRENIFKILISQPVVDRLVLSHLYERDYEMEDLEFLYMLSRFIDGIQIYKNAYIGDDCEKYSGEWNKYIQSVLDASISDPVKAYLDLKSMIRSLQKCEEPFDIDYEACKVKFNQVLENMISCVPQLAQKIKEINNRPSSYYYETVIKSLVRPRFSSSRIYASPPSNTEFLESYEVQRKTGRIMLISIYKFTDRPESLYFSTPAEYNMRPIELEIIEAVRKKMIKHRPNDLNFSDPANSREYFRRLGKQMLGRRNTFDVYKPHS